jgi:hypothetical protein
MESGVVDPARPFATHLARVLVHLREERASGVLDVEGDGLRTSIVLADGVLVSADGGSPDDALDRVLLRGGQLDEGDLTRVRAQLGDGSHDPMALAHTAIQLGVIAPDAVVAAMHAQVHARVTRCLRLERAVWTFRSERGAAHGITRHPMRIEHVVFDALSEPEEAARWDARLAPWARHHPALHSEGGATTSSLGLTPARLRAMRSCDGTRTLDALLASGIVPRAQMVALVVALLFGGRLELLPEPRPRERPSSIPPSVGTPSSASESPTVGRRPPSATRIAAPTPTATDRAATAAQLRSELERRGLHGPRAEPRTSSSPEASLASGRRLLHEGRIVPARAELALAVAGLSASVEARMLASFADYLGEHDASVRATLASEAQAHALERTRTDKQDGFAHHVLGRLAYDRGDDDGALKAYRTAHALDPKDVEAQRMHRVLAARLKK